MIGRPVVEPRTLRPGRGVVIAPPCATESVAVSYEYSSTEVPDGRPPPGPRAETLCARDRGGAREAHAARRGAAAAVPDPGPQRARALALPRWRAARQGQPHAPRARAR